MVTDQRSGQGVRGLGLTEEQAAESRRINGSNRLTEKKGISFGARLWRSLGDPVTRVLLAALGVNFLMALRSGGWVETVGIAVAVLLASTVSALSEHTSARAFQRLSEDADGAVEH